MQQITIEALQNRISTKPLVPFPVLLIQYMKRIPISSGVVGKLEHISPDILSLRYTKRLILDEEETTALCIGYPYFNYEDNPLGKLCIETKCIENIFIISEK